MDNFSLVQVLLVGVAWGALGFYWGGRLSRNKLMPRIKRLKNRIDELENPEPDVEPINPQK